VCGSVLQRVAVCCSVLQRVAVCSSVLQCVAVCCSVLQRVAVCCSVFQCVAVCCSVLQCVAVCCSVIITLKLKIFSTVTPCTQTLSYTTIATYCNTLTLCTALLHAATQSPIAATHSPIITLGTIITSCSSSSKTYSIEQYNPKSRYSIDRTHIVLLH